MCLTAHAGGTGEGETIGILVSYGAPQHEGQDPVEAISQEFIDSFGHYLATGASFKTPEYVLERYGSYLPETTKRVLKGELRPLWTYQFKMEHHINFS